MTQAISNTDLENSFVMLGFENENAIENLCLESIQTIEEKAKASHQWIISACKTYESTLNFRKTTGNNDVNERIQVIYKSPEKRECYIGNNDIVEEESLKIFKQDVGNLRNSIEFIEKIVEGRLVSEQQASIKNEFKEKISNIRKNYLEKGDRVWTIINYLEKFEEMIQESKEDDSGSTDMVVG